MSVFFSASLKAGCVAPDRSKLEVGRLVKVLDGDTFLFEPQGRVRLNLINTPEMNYGKTLPPEPFAKQAMESVRSMQRHHRFDLEVVGRDKYQRLLANLWVYPKDDVRHSHGQSAGERTVFAERTMLAEQLIKQGLGFQVFESSSAYASCLAQAEKLARKQQLGVWQALSFWLNRARGGFVLWSDAVKKVSRSKRYLWVSLSEERVVRVPRVWFESFDGEPKVGQWFEVRGWAIERKNTRYEPFMMPLKTVDALNIN